MSNFNRNELKNKTLAEFLPATPPPASQSQEYYEDEEDVTFFERFKLIVPIIIIAIICFIAYAWYTDKFAISTSSSDLPIITASKDPLREKPEDPGGMKIINRDKRVYDTISGKDNDNDTKPANILPAPEEPISHEEIERKATLPELVNKLPTQDKSSSNDEVKTSSTITTNNSPELSSSSENTTTGTQKAAEISSNTVNATPEPSPKATTSTIPALATNIPTQDTTQTTTITTRAKEETKAVTAADITDIAPTKQSTQKNKVPKINLSYRIQLGSYRSTGDAESSWKTMKKKFPDLLNGLNEYIEKADLGDKGIFYRLQLSGFKNESDARKICQKLTIQKQGCFFVGK